MKVLLSIKPEFADKIFDGTKIYEFRRLIFKNKNVKTIVVYASSPVQKVIGEFEVEEIMKDDLENLWQKTKNKAGIDESYFFEYFQGKIEGFAIKIKSAIRYQDELCLKADFKVHPPQSFIYLK